MSVDPDLNREIARLQRLGIRELKARYAEVFGEAASGNNRTWLLRRIAWRLQATAEGDLSERARRRAAELADDAALRMNPPRARTPAPGEERTSTKSLRPSQDNRLPPPGTVLTRKYKGRDLQVQVLPDGFRFEGENYPSLSAVAKAITGSHCNGFLFFKLTKGGDS
jgi:hypothetical protein